jgi:hypothetical protein
MHKVVTNQGAFFENFIVDLINASGPINVSFIQSGYDTGFDLEGTYLLSQKDKLIPQRWLVTIKRSAIPRIGPRELEIFSQAIKSHYTDKILFVTSAQFTPGASLAVANFNKQHEDKLIIWDKPIIIGLYLNSPSLRKKYEHSIENLIPGIHDFISAEPKKPTLIERLANCKPGEDEWGEYESIGTAILTEVFVPPLKRPMKQPPTLDGVQRRDILFGLRGVEGPWKEIREEFEAKFLVFDFKNYKEPIGPNEVDDINKYLNKKTIGRLGILVSRKGPTKNAKRRRNSIYNSPDEKVILFLDDNDLIELYSRKKDNKDPLDFLQERIDKFYAEHE